MNITRRKFIAGAATAGAAITLTGITGCSSGNGAQADGSITEETSDEIAATATKEADIVIVGAGMSGLTAAVSASEGNSTVILLEANSVVGGNGQGTEGIFACGSSLQKELGIDFSFEDVITKELEFFNHRTNALFWKDMVSASADNIDWLMKQGVKFGAVDNYRGQGHLDGFHWYADEDPYNFITPMLESAEKQGVEILLETRGRKLIMEDGSVAGIYAETADGSYIQINCKAVILASGGYADNDELLAELGVDVKSIARKGFPNHNGDGLDMAVSVGGVDTRMSHCIMREPGCEGYGFETALGAMGVHSGGPFMFVNENGERYTDENCAAKNFAYAANCVLSQQKSYAIINEKCLAWLDENSSPGIVDAAEDALSIGAKAYKTNTIEELADAIEVDPEILSSELERYNDLCEKGNDDDFAKDQSMMQTMDEGPYWAFKQGLFYFTTMGGIRTNRRFEVVDKDYKPISGLWAVGADGCELYKETYTVMVPASANANNVNSGRTAAQEALTYCKTL